MSKDLESTPDPTNTQTAEWRILMRPQKKEMGPFGKIRKIGGEVLEALVLPGDKMKTAGAWTLTGAVAITAFGVVIAEWNGIKNGTDLDWLQNRHPTPTLNVTPSPETTSPLLTSPDGIVLRASSNDLTCDTESVNGHFVDAAIKAGDVAAAKGNLSQTARDNAHVAVPATAAAYAATVPTIANPYDLANTVTVCLDPSNGQPTITTN